MDIVLPTEGIDVSTGYSTLHILVHNEKRIEGEIKITQHNASATCYQTPAISTKTFTVEKIHPKMLDFPTRPIKLYYMPAKSHEVFVKPGFKYEIALTAAGTTHRICLLFKNNTEELFAQFF